MKEIIWLGYQIFGEGAGDGGGAGTGETSADAGQSAESRLLELGVPAEKIRKRAKTAAAPEVKAPAVTEKPEQQDAAADDPAAEEAATEETPPARMSWEEIMADPEYNRQMQAVVQSRLRSAKTAEESLAKISPALEVLAGKYHMDPANMDMDALSEAIQNDNQFYEEQAVNMGVDVNTARDIDRKARDDARKQREDAQTLEQQKFQEHFQKLEQQGEAMKSVFPKFDLRTELQNPAFARMTSPGVGLSVEDAYYAIHRKEIQTATAQAAAQQTAKKISNSIQSGQRRPAENGAGAQAPSVTTFDYAKATKAQREALKQRIREAAARGEKLYPGR